MSVLPLTSLGTTPCPPSASDTALTVVKPKMSRWNFLAGILEHGGPGCLQFAITNVCNAKCAFCGFAVDRFDPAQRRTVTLREAEDVIDIAAHN